jgi:ABC-type sugar transport system substrate-binding protein
VRRHISRCARVPYSAASPSHACPCACSPPATLAFCLAAPNAGAQSVAFINPGKSDEVYWVTAARGMQAAADDLGMKLEVRYTERDHTKAIEIARELAARPASTRPRYAVITNDNATGVGLLKVLDAAGISTVFAYSSLPPRSAWRWAGRVSATRAGWAPSSPRPTMRVTSPRAT